MIKLQQFANTEGYFISHEGDNGHSDEVYDVPLSSKKLTDASFTKFFWSNLDNEGRTLWKEPEMTLEEAMPFIYSSYALDNAVDSFERRVWYPYLSKQINASEKRGMKLRCKGIQLLTYVMAGRCMLTMNKSKTSFTLITAENEAPYSCCGNNILARSKMGPMGWQSINATANEACDMVYTLIAEGKNLQLKDDDKVSMGF